MAVGVEIVTTDEMVARHVEGLDALTIEDEKNNEQHYSSLRSHILSAFQENRDARESGGANKLMLDSLRAYNGQYDPEDLAKIAEEGGSSIFMNLTSTKVRAAISWIKDILLAGKEDAFSIEPTPLVELPIETQILINEKVTKDFEEMLKSSSPEAGAPEVGPDGQPRKPEIGPDGQPVPPQQQKKPDIIETLKELQEAKRDLYDAIQDELNKEAAFAFKITETKIKDQMKQGKWEYALSEFIDDFCIFPTAFMKGPIVTVKKQLKWVHGEVKPVEDYLMMNRRVSPLDIYPAKEAATVMDGNFIEHLRMSRKELSNLRKANDYDKEAIKRVLSNSEGKGYSAGVDTNIEDEKAQEELRESALTSNEHVYHGLHFFGSAPAKLLREWGMSEEKLDPKLEDDEEIDIEAILVGTEIIKCVLNDDPLGRRPYYCASYQKRPGSIWGISPPYMMRDIQRMCNACARALNNNMGLSSGPIMEVNVERLADGQEIYELRPRDVVQTTSDPTGAGGRAVSFFTIPSVAKELLAVYKEFEVKADDVTMIPRYAYGNERTGGAAQTASGLSMLLESASKGIKDAIRHIDEGVIIPRVEMEFYTTMLRGDNSFSGDINVIARGSQTLTLAGAEQMRRNEFLQMTANPVDQGIMGKLGRAEILRIMAKDLGLGGNVVPNRQELKAQERKQKEQEQQPPQSVMAAKIQNETNMAIAQERNARVDAEIQRKKDRDAADVQLKAREQEQRDRADATRATARLQEQALKNRSEEHRANQAIALSLETGDKANSV